MSKQKNILMVIAVLIISYNALAQDGKFSLSGRVVDSKKLGIGMATVKLTADRDGFITLKTVTGDDGSFMFRGLADGSYEISVTCVGYKSHTRKTDVKGDTNVGDIWLEDAYKMLDEITVMANYTDVKLTGGTVVKVKGNPLAKGKTVIDFLQYVRDLDVTQSELSIRGKANTLIYLEDRKITFDQLKSISPSMIESIEIIPHADGSYGLLATGGVVKIHLRKDGGMIGSATLYSVVNTEGMVGEAPMVNVLYSKGEWTLSNYLTPFEYTRYPSITQQHDISGGATDQTDTKDISRDKAIRDNLSLRYSFNKTDHIDIYGGVSASCGDNIQTSVSGGDKLYITSKPETQYYSAGTQYRKGWGHDGKNYFHIRIDYSKYKSDSRQGYDYNGQAERASQKYDMCIVDIAPRLHLALKESMDFNIGVQYVYESDRHEDKGTPTLGYILDGKYNYKMYYYGAWMEYSATLGKSLYLKLGLNYSATDERNKDFLNSGNDISTRQDGIYPTLQGQWIVDRSKMRYLSIGYRHYYSMPNYNYRLPTVVWQGENLYSVGNTNLKKENYDDIDIYFSFDRNLSVSYNMSYGRNMVNVIMHKDENRPGTYFTRPENTAFSMMHTFRLAYAGRIFKFWYTNTYAMFTYKNARAGDDKIKHARVVFRSNNDFSVCKNFGLTYFFEALGKNKTESYESNATYSMDFGVYMSLMKGKMNIRLLYENAFYKRRITTTRGDGWTKRRINLSPDSHILLTLGWNFNAGRKIKKQELPTVNKQERKIPTF